MNIKLEYEQYRKDIIDIVRIFQDEVNFVDDSDIVIGKDYIFTGAMLPFSSKVELKRLLYTYLADKHQYTSPWGLITGTKPQKLYNKYDEAYILENYLISPEKLKILREIEKGHRMKAFSKNNIHLYINIPFCPSRCSYCSFPTIIYTKNDRRQEYLDGLKSEILALRDAFENRNLRTIYIGGGTPSALTHKQMEDLFNTLQDSFDLSSLEEFTVEAGREDTLDKDKLDLMKAYHVTRISINPQSFNEKTNQRIGRNQDLDSLKKLYKLAVDMGFIVNMDLILGLSGESISEVENTFNEIEKLMPHNLTVHTLSLKKGSKLNESGDSLNDERKAIKDMLDFSQNLTKKMGYKPYYLYRQKEILGNLENIGYCLDDQLCIYNIVSNEENESILGLGMTSNSKILVDNNIVKYTNYKNLDEYLDKLDQQILEKRKILED